MNYTEPKVTIFVDTTVNVSLLLMRTLSLSTNYLRRSWNRIELYNSKAFKDKRLYSLTVQMTYEVMKYVGL